MYLTKIELCGFKSFPDRTVFEFDAGITAILGPNGCGKSNVVDAVKWVLGESRAKSLRGDRMLDVIFAGSEQRKPMGMAEVSLYFNNEDHTLATEYNEVCVTRRLYRSGDSEYLINKQQCRRRDIRELFMDTGVGTSAYSFIEQGKVEAMLNAKPDERRAVFEEAAGISKYKARRKEALARLDRTNQYLDRVNDVVEEIERGIRRTARQAANARRFQRLKDNLDNLKGHLYARQFASLREKLEQVNSEKDEINELFSTESSHQAALSSRISELNQTEITLTEELRTYEQSQMKIQEDLTRVQVDLSTAAERFENTKRESVEADQRIQAIRTRLEQLDNEVDRLTSSLDSERKEFSLLQHDFDEREACRCRLQEGFAQCTAKMDAMRRTTREIAEKREGLLREIARLESDESFRREQAQNILQRLDALSEEQGNARQELTRLEQQMQTVAADIARLDSEVTTRRRQQQAMQEEDANYARRLQELENERTAKVARLSTLEDLQKSLAGAHAGVKAVFAARQEGQEFCTGIRGMVAELLSVPTPVAGAIEALLADHAQDIITTTTTTAMQCIDFLARAGSGRARFIPLDRVTGRGRLSPDLTSAHGVLGEAIELVKFDPCYRAAMESLLAGVLVVGTREDASNLAAGHGRGIRMVTLEGEIFDADGAVIGGAGNGGGGIISRKAEMESIASGLQELATRTRSVEAGRRQNAAALAGVGEMLRADEEKLSELTPIGQKLGNQITVIRNSLERISRDEEKLREEHERLQSTADTLNQRIRELTAEERTCRDRLAEAEAGMGAVETEQRSLRVRLDEVQEAVAGLREQRAQVQSSIAERERRLETIALDQRERTREVEHYEAVITQAATETKSLEEQLESLREKEFAMLTERDKLQHAATDLRQQLGTTREELNEKRSAEQALQRRLSQIQEAQNQLNLRENECSLRLQAIEEKAREEQGIEDLAERSQATVMLDAEGEPMEPMTDEQLEENIREIAGRIERIGPVNMEAIDEQAELEARAEFLKSDRDDLLEAARDLLSVIERLNDECAKRFDETFENVRKNFQELFRMLFGGGKGDLILEDIEGVKGIDRLDAGIEVIARPPGKEPKSISLLSGGEKALCAVALLFAIFRSKPSPFCILDEVDGPLDESNIDRFMTAVKEFSRDTQFVLISHAKRTMSMTEIIYGVTQEEPGVSTKYSLRFRQEYDRDTTPSEAPLEEAVVAG